MNNNKSSKKTTPGTLAVLGLYILFGGTCGFFIMDHINKSLSDTSPYWYELVLFLIMLVLLYASIFASTILHELGHLIFGRITGYKLLSFRMGSLMLIKRNGKFKLKRYSIPGTAGQCLMAPPQVTVDACPVVLYNLGGVMVNIFAAIVLAAVYVFTRNMLFGAIFIIAALANVLTAITNGIPMDVGGVNNDGKNAILASKSLIARQALITQLKINEAVSNGIRASYMPEEWFIMPEDSDKDDTLVSSIGVFYCQRLLDLNMLEMAMEEIGSLFEKRKVLDIYKKMLLCDLIYCKLVTGCDRAEISALITREQKNFMKAMNTSVGIIRTELAIALLYDKNTDLADKIMEKFEKTAKKYPYEAEIEGERELIGIARRCAE